MPEFVTENKRSLNLEVTPEVLSLGECQKELLNLLLKFDGFCKGNDLVYSLDAGTLLGAIRHQGFIPWDADVDVAMPRPSYNKLLSLADKLPSGYKFVGMEDGFAYPFIKFCNLGIAAQEKSYEGTGYQDFLWVDIFPWDGVPEEKVESLAKKIGWLKRRLAWLSINIPQTYDDDPLKRCISGAYAAIPFKTLRRRSLIRGIDKVIRTLDYDKADYVASLCTDDTRFWKLPKTVFESMTSVRFEGHEFSAFSCWDQYLTDLYGDYSVLPPVEERVDHHDFKAWYIR